MGVIEDLKKMLGIQPTEAAPAPPTGLGNAIGAGPRSEEIIGAAPEKSEGKSVGPNVPRQQYYQEEK
jgi:hypothetical protein